jgi:hypothetical protein
MPRAKKLVWQSDKTRPVTEAECNARKTVLFCVRIPKPLQCQTPGINVGSD